MSRYSPGDLVLAFIRFGGGDLGKVRPAVVVGESGAGSYNVYPVTGSEPDGSSYVPVGLRDFEYGGLDLVEESYILVSMPVEIRINEIKGKKGRLSRAFLENLPDAC